MAAALLLPFCLLFVGDAQVPIGQSAVTVPLGVIVLVPLLALMSMAGRVTVSRSACLLLVVLLSGLIGTVLTPQAQTSRAAAGSLPLVYAVVALLVYEATRPRPARIVNWMLFGGIVLAVWVIALGAPNIGSEGDYYEDKLLVETLLGRSNYLSAFLLFLVGMCWSRHRFLAPLFMFAMVCTMSRGGVLMLVLFFIAAWLARRDKLWLIGLLSFFAFVATAAVVALYQVDAFEAFLDPSDTRVGSTINRLLLWSFGVELWTSQPLVGIGPNTFRTFVETTDGMEDVWGVHNSILLMLLNYGVIGVIVYGLYVREIYRAIVKAEVVDAGVAYLRAVFVVLLVFSLFEPLVGSAAFELLLVLIYVFARSIVRSGPAGRRLARPRTAPALP